jgi:hypothetical protein
LGFDDVNKAIALGAASQVTATSPRDLSDLKRLYFSAITAASGVHTWVAEGLVQVATRLSPKLARIDTSDWSYDPARELCDYGRLPDDQVKLVQSLGSALTADPSPRHDIHHRHVWAFCAAKLAVAVAKAEDAGELATLLEREIGPHRMQRARSIAFVNFSQVLEGKLAQRGLMGASSS